MPRLENPLGSGLSKFFTLPVIIGSVLFFVVIIVLVFFVVVQKHTKQEAHFSSPENLSLQSLDNSSFSTAALPSNQQTVQTNVQPMQQSSFTNDSSDASFISLKSYVNEKLGQGYTPAQVSEHLISVGWSSQLVEQVFSSIQHDRDSFGMQGKMM